jgi:hypothetical protein
MATKELSGYQIGKTLFGIINSLDELFDGFTYTNCTPDNGRQPLRPENYYFLASDANCIDTWGNKKMTISLGARPLKNVLAATVRRCTGTKVGSFHIVPWPDCGYTLIFANDTNHIAQPWLAFIRTDNLPILNVDLLGCDGVGTISEHS